jgi:transcriptional regulator with XRE-family HTH domain
MHLSAWISQQQGLTQREFAERVGVTQGRIAQLLSGDIPSMALAVRIRTETQGEVALDDWIETAVAD